jgi:AhpD family alkylhydroperoxidase
MSRVPLLAPGDVDLVTRQALNAAKRRLGVVPDSWAAAAHHRTLLLGQGAFELAFERSDAVPRRLKELAVLKAAMVVECEFCIDIGSMEARKLGVRDDELAGLADPHGSGAFSELELLVLDLAVAMTRTPQEVTDELWSALREHFDDRQMVELTTMIAWENFRARLNHALGLGAQGFDTTSTAAAPPVTA